MKFLILVVRSHLGYPRSESSPVIAQLHDEPSLLLHPRKWSLKARNKQRKDAKLIQGSVEKTCSVHNLSFSSSSCVPFPLVRTAKDDRDSEQAETTAVGWGWEEVSLLELLLHICRKPGCLELCFLSPA